MEIMNDDAKSARALNEARFPWGYRNRLAQRVLMERSHRRQLTKSDRRRAVETRWQLRELQASRPRPQ